MFTTIEILVNFPFRFQIPSFHDLIGRITFRNLGEEHEWSAASPLFSTCTIQKIR